MSGIADINISIVESLDIVERVHNFDYLKYLKEISEQVREIALTNNNPTESIYPSVHPYIDFGHTKNKTAQRGMFAFDIYTPIMRNTFDGLNFRNQSKVKRIRNYQVVN